MKYLNHSQPYIFKGFPGIPLNSDRIGQKCWVHSYEAETTFTDSLKEHLVIRFEDGAEYSTACEGYGGSSVDKFIEPYTERPCFYPGGIYEFKATPSVQCCLISISECANKAVVRLLNHTKQKRLVSLNDIKMITLERRPGRKLYSLSPLTDAFGDWCIKNLCEIVAKQAVDALVKGLNMNSNSCPTVKTMKPLERIHAKGDRFRSEIEVLNGRLDKLDKIEDSVNWKNATDDIQNRAVESADIV